MSKARAKWDMKDQAEGLMLGMSLDELKDWNSVKSFMKKNGVKLHPTALGHVRKKVIHEKGGKLKNESDDGLLSHITIVSKAAGRVGGLEKLESVIKVIKKVKEL